jgi:hypothetical protein
MTVPLFTVYLVVPGQLLRAHLATLDPMENPENRDNGAVEKSADNSTAGESQPARRPGVRGLVNELLRNVLPEQSSAVQVLLNASGLPDCASTNTDWSDPISIGQNNAPQTDRKQCERDLMKSAHVELFYRKIERWRATDVCHLNLATVQRLLIQRMQWSIAKKVSDLYAEDEETVKTALSPRGELTRKLHQYCKRPSLTNRAIAKR